MEGRKSRSCALPLVEDVAIDGDLVVNSNNCFVQGVQHHHGSQLLAAMMDLWSSFSRFGVPTFHRRLEGWRQLTPVRTPAPVWEGIATRSSSFCRKIHASVRAPGIEKE